MYVRITLVAVLVVLMLLVSSMTTETRQEREPDWWDADPPIDPDSDEAVRRTGEMAMAIVEGDADAGYRAEAHLPGVSYDDAQLLARYMAAVRKPGWAQAWTLAAGEVLVNRMASPEFEATTIREVLFGPDGGVGEFPALGAAAWDDAVPEIWMARAAVRLLLGDSLMRDPQMVHIGPVARTTGYGYVFVGTDGSVTYICRTSHPELYP